MSHGRKKLCTCQAILESLEFPLLVMTGSTVHSLWWLTEIIIMFLPHQLHQIYLDRCLRVYPTVTYTSWTTSLCWSVLYRCHLGGVTLKHSKHDLFNARVKKLKKEHLLQTFITSRTAHHGTWNSNLTYVKHIVCRWISPILNIIFGKMQL